MKLLRLLTLRSLLSRRMRSALTLFGIILGVASIFSINYTNHNAYRSINQLFEGTAGRVNLEIRSSARTGGFSQEILTDLDGIDGIQQASPVLKLAAAFPDENITEIDLNFFGTGSGGFLIHGIDPQQDAAVRDYQVTAGRFLDPDSEMLEMVLVQDYADEHQIEIDQITEILTSRGLIEIKLVGLMAQEGAGWTNFGQFGVVNLPVAQQMFLREGEIDQIDIVADLTAGGPDRVSELKDRLTALLGEDYLVAYPANQGDSMVQMLSGYQIGLNFLAGIALFVGVFLIYNTFSMTVVERTRELGLLRCVGMTGRQVARQVIWEGVFLGLAGAVLGIGLGILLSQGLMLLMTRLLGQSLNMSRIPLPLLAGSLAAGIAVTLIASLIPAKQAGRISPLAALRLRSRSDEGWLMRYGWMMGVILLIISSSILIWNPFPYDVQFRLGSLTVFTLFFGAMFIIPTTLKIWQRVFRWPIRLFFGSLGEIGSRNLERARKRTMLTCAALMVGVSMIVVTQGITGSFTQDLDAWMDAYIGGDIFVSSALPMEWELKEKLESVNGVEKAAPVRHIDVTWMLDDGEENISFMAVDPQSHAALTRFVFSEEDVDEEAAMAALTDGRHVFVSGVIAEKYGVKAGDPFRLKTTAESYDLTVAAVVLDFFNQGMVITGNWTDMKALYQVDAADTFLIAVRNPADTKSIIQAIKSAHQEDYQLIVESNQAIRERADSLMDQAFIMFDVLGVISVMVAALGVLNTLSMSVIERTREIGMLRAMGMTRMQMIRMILAEAGLLGVIGSLLGLLFGVALTRIFLVAMGAMSGYALTFIMPVRAMWLSIISALLVSQLAALLPAVRAGRIPVLTAIHYE